MPFSNNLIDICKHYLKIDQNDKGSYRTISILYTLSMMIK